MISNYLNSLIARLRRHSLDVNLKDAISDIPWLLWDENQNKHEYLFLNDNRVILSLNGVTEIGTWEILPTNAILIVKPSGNLTLKYELMFDYAILVLKVNGPMEFPFVLYNHNKIPEGDLMAYIETYERGGRLPRQGQSRTSVSQSSPSEFPPILIILLVLGLFYCFYAIFKH